MFKTTVIFMIIDHPYGLHKGIARGRANKFKAFFL